MTTSAAPTLTASTPAARAAAGRQAIADCPEAFEELRGEGDRELLEHAASIDTNVIAALDTIGAVPQHQSHLLGKFLAEQIVEDAIDAEATKQLGAYRAAKATEIVTDPAAYDYSDPKHPAFLDYALPA
ncbi:MAG TPA: hypothetical protein VF867_04370 [Arthrobacter sp.]